MKNFHKNTNPQTTFHFSRHIITYFYLAVPLEPLAGLGGATSGGSVLRSQRTGSSDIRPMGGSPPIAYRAHPPALTRQALGPIPPQDHPVLREVSVDSPGDYCP